MDLSTRIRGQGGYWITQRFYDASDEGAFAPHFPDLPKSLHSCGQEVFACI